MNAIDTQTTLLQRVCGRAPAPRAHTRALSAALQWWRPCRRDAIHIHASSCSGDESQPSTSHCWLDPTAQYTHTHTHIQTDLDDRDQCSASRVQRTSNWAAASVVRTNALALAPDLPDLPDLTDLSVDSSQKQKRVQCDRQKSEHAVSTVKSPASRSLSVSLPAGLPRPR
jgi:hypothetical protein